LRLGFQNGKVCGIFWSALYSIIFGEVPDGKLPSTAQRVRRINT
jgi:hypothetical protein